ncbi:MAG: hypothetical protein ACFFED_07730 [Candidatus Thorarchaeota archaeon]
MDPYVVKIPEEQLDELRVFLLDFDNTHQRTTSNQYEAFRFYYAGGVIVAYTSGKIVANSPETASLLTTAVQSLSKDSMNVITIGSDEAGKGEWLGPLTVAAVALNEKQEIYLRSVGVMDSKELSAGKIGELAYEIEENSLAIETLLIPPKVFEDRLKEMHAEGKNLNDLLAWAHTEVISTVYSKIRKIKAKPRIVVDEFDKNKTLERLGKKIDLSKIPLEQMHRAERVTAVAAASIMARDLREEWIDKASLRLGIELEGMSIAEARKRKDLREFAKISYLK